MEGGIIMATATLTSKGQVTIPASVRAALGLGVGSRIERAAPCNRAGYPPSQV